MSAPNPFIDRSKELLLQRAALEAEDGGQLFELVLKLDLSAALCLTGQLHLALRHPANNGPSADAAREVIDGVIQRLRDAGLWANAEICALGSDPTYDEGWT